MHRILVIGTGSIGERHIRCLQATRRATVGMVELREGLRVQIAKRYNVQEVFDSLDAALEAQWDAAVIAAPAQLHIPIALQLADQGVHLLIEKPLAVKTTDIDLLLEKVKQNKLHAAVLYVWRAHPSVAAMRQAIMSNRFGQPVQLVATCGQSFPFFRPAYRDTYYTDRAKGGGAIQDSLTHVIDTGQWLVGPFQRLCADAAHQVLEGVEVEDTVHVIARQGAEGAGGDGGAGSRGDQAVVCSSYSHNQYQAPNEAIITVVCQRGTLRLEMHNHRWGWVAGPEDDWQYEPAGLTQRDDWFICQANAMLDMLQGKAKPLCSLEEALHTLQVNLAILQAADEQSGWVTLNH